MQEKPEAREAGLEPATSGFVDRGSPSQHRTTGAESARIDGGAVQWPVPQNVAGQATTPSRILPDEKPGAHFPPIWVFVLGVLLWAAFIVALRAVA